MSNNLSLQKILSAKRFQDLFSDDTKKEYRRVLKYAHPDMHPGDEARAKEAFIQVNKIWKLGNSTPLRNSEKEANESRTDQIFSKKYEYDEVSLHRISSGVNHYKARISESRESVMISITNHPKVSPLILSGVKNMKDVKSNIPEQYREFYPEILDAFYLPQDGMKLASVTQKIGNGFYSLREVNEDYPKGISNKDAAWMFRRMLVAIGNLHDVGYSHSGISLDTFLIEPETHALILQDFHYIVPLDSPAEIVNNFSKKFYKEDKTTSVKKDLQMLVSLISSLVNIDELPKRMKIFYKNAALYPASSAAEMLGDYDYLLEEVYGERKFHKFKMVRS